METNGTVENINNPCRLCNEKEAFVSYIRCGHWVCQKCLVIPKLISNEEKLCSLCREAQGARSGVNHQGMIVDDDELFEPFNTDKAYQAGTLTMKDTRNQAAPPERLLAVRSSGLTATYKRISMTAPNDVKKSIMAQSFVMVNDWGEEEPEKWKIFASDRKYVFDV